MKTHACFHTLATGLLLGIGSTFCHAQTLDVPWALSYGLTAPGATVDSILVDPQGDTFLAGLYTLAPFAVGGLGLDAPPNFRAAYIAEVDPDGQPLWLKSIDSAQNRPGIFSFARDASSNLWAVGSFDTFYGPATFDGTDLTNGGGLVLKLDPDGNTLWAKSIDSTSNCVALAVAIDSAENVVVAGVFQQSVSIDGTTVSTNGPGDFGFVAKLAPTGQLLWIRLIDGQQWPNRLLPGLAGDIYALVNAPNDPSASSVVRFTSTGDQSWTFSAGSAHAIAVDRAGKVAVVGSFGTPTLTIGNTLITNRGGTAGYVAVLNTNGQPERVVPLVSDDSRWSSTSPNPVSVDEANNLIIVGRFSNDANGAALTLGGRTLTVDANQTVFFLASIAPDNTFNWLLSLGGGDLQFDGAVVTGLSYGGLIPGPGRSMLLNGHNHLDASIGNQSLPPNQLPLWGSPFLAEVVLPPLPPRLSIASNPAQLQLSWPTNATGFVLQAATTLANGGDWQDSSLTLTIVGDQNVVTVDTTGPSGFFRLHQP